MDNPGQGVLSAVHTGLTETFDLSALSWKQVIALVGLVMLAMLAWRQVINAIAENI